MGAWVADGAGGIALRLLPHAFRQKAGQTQRMPPGGIRIRHWPGTHWADTASEGWRELTPCVAVPRDTDSGVWRRATGAVPGTGRTGPQATGGGGEDAAVRDAAAIAVGVE